MWSQSYGSLGTIGLAELDRRYRGQVPLARWLEEVEDEVLDWLLEKQKKKCGLGVNVAPTPAMMTAMCQQWERIKRLVPEMVCCSWFYTITQEARLPCSAPSTVGLGNLIQGQVRPSLNDSLQHAKRIGVALSEQALNGTMHELYEEEEDEEDLNEDGTCWKNHITVFCSVAMEMLGGGTAGAAAYTLPPQHQQLRLHLGAGCLIQAMAACTRAMTAAHREYTRSFTDREMPPPPAPKQAWSVYDCWGSDPQHDGGAASLHMTVGPWQPTRLPPADADHDWLNQLIQPNTFGPVALCLYEAKRRGADHQRSSEHMVGNPSGFLNSLMLKLCSPGTSKQRSQGFEQIANKLLDQLKLHSSVLSHAGALRSEITFKTVLVGDGGGSAIDQLKEEIAGMLGRLYGNTPPSILKSKAETFPKLVEGVGTQSINLARLYVKEALEKQSFLKPDQIHAVICLIALPAAILDGIKSRSLFNAALRKLLPFTRIASRHQGFLFLPSSLLTGLEGMALQSPFPRTQDMSLPLLLNQMVKDVYNGNRINSSEVQHNTSSMTLFFNLFVDILPQVPPTCYSVLLAKMQGAAVALYLTQKLHYTVHIKIIRRLQRQRKRTIKVEVKKIREGASTLEMREGTGIEFMCGQEISQFIKSCMAAEGFDLQEMTIQKYSMLQVSMLLSKVKAMASLRRESLNMKAPHNMPPWCVMAVPFFSALSSLQRNGGEDGVRDLMEALIRDLLYRSQPHCAVLVGEPVAAARTRMRDGVTKLTIEHPPVASQADTLILQKAQESYYHTLQDAIPQGVDINTYVARTLDECLGMMDLVVAAWLHNKGGIETLEIDEELVDMNGVVITSDGDDDGEIVGDDDTASDDSEDNHDDLVEEGEGEQEGEEEEDIY